MKNPNTFWAAYYVTMGLLSCELTPEQYETAFAAVTKNLKPINENQNEKE